MKLCVFIMLFLASCSNVNMLSYDIEKVSSCQKTINGMLLLTNHDILPQKGFYTGKEAKLDVNRYFDVLEHLSMESGYTLDYVQFLDSWGAKPFIYARQSKHPSYESYSDYTESVNNVGNEEYSWQELANTYD